MHRRLISYIQVILAMLIWGSLSLFVKPIGYASGEIVLARIISGLAFLLVVYAFSRHRSPRRAILRFLPRMLLSGAAMGFNWVALFAAYSYVDVSIATLCYYVSPVFVMIGSILLFKQRLGAPRALGMGAAVAGMVCVTGTVMGGSDPLRGILLGLVSAVLYAAVTLSVKGVEGISSLEVTLCQLLGALAVILPYALISHKGAWRAPTLTEVGCMLALGIVHTGGALYMYFSAIRGLSVQSAALLSYIDPMSALGFAAVFLGERMTALQWVGAALILGGALTGELLGQRKSPDH